MGNTNSVVSDDVTIRNDVERSIMVWLDAEVNSNIENQKIQQNIRGTVKQLKTFTDGNECEKYIQSKSSQERILLIVNSQQGQQIVPHIHELQQLVSIYVYFKGGKGNEQWTNNYSKVKHLVCMLFE
jgi:hypothetical protein